MITVCLIIWFTLPPYWFELTALKESLPIPQENVVAEKIETLEEMETRLYQEGYTTDDLKEFLKQLSIKYGIDYEKISNTVNGESGWNTQAVSWNLSSHGISQYTLKTWLYYCSDNDDRKEDPIKALKCMSRMFYEGEQHQWDAYCEQYYSEKCIDIRGIYPK